MAAPSTPPRTERSRAAFAAGASLNTSSAPAGAAAKDSANIFGSPVTPFAMKPALSGNQSKASDGRDRRTGAPAAGVTGANRPEGARERDASGTGRRQAAMPATADSRRASHHQPALQSFSLYETASRYYLVGSDANEIRFRILKIDRTASGTQLALTEDEGVYNANDIATLLSMVAEGNRANGGLRRVATAHGLLGFIRFMEGYYMVLIIKRSQVAVVGGHAIFHVDDAQFFPMQLRADVPVEPYEQSYLELTKGINLGGHFYFSYTYDLTRTLQQNLDEPHGTDYGRWSR